MARRAVSRSTQAACIISDIEPRNLVVIEAAGGVAIAYPGALHGLGLCRLIGVELAQQRLVIGVEEIVPDRALDVVTIGDGRVVLCARAGGARSATSLNRQFSSPASRSSWYLRRAAADRRHFLRGRLSRLGVRRCRPSRRARGEHACRKQPSAHRPPRFPLVPTVAAAPILVQVQNQGMIPALSSWPDTRDPTFGRPEWMACSGHPPPFPRQEPCLAEPPNRRPAPVGLA